MEVKIKLEPESSGFFPKRANPEDAGYDLCSRIDAVLEPLSGTAIPVGFAMELPSGDEAQISPPQRICSQTSHHCDQLPPVQSMPIFVAKSKRSSTISAESLSSSNELTASLKWRSANCRKIELIEAIKLSQNDRNTNGFGSSGR